MVRLKTVSEVFCQRDPKRFELAVWVSIDVVRGGTDSLDDVFDYVFGQLVSVFVDVQGYRNIYLWRAIWLAAAQGFAQRKIGE